jgi:hypothetical protein
LAEEISFTVKARPEFDCFSARWRQLPSMRYFFDEEMIAARRWEEHEANALLSPHSHGVFLLLPEIPFIGLFF